jgi:hypothetical protein
MVTSKVQGGAVSRGFRLPTHDEMLRTYKGIVMGRMKNGSLKPMKKAPPRAEKYPKYNITDPRKAGVKTEVYVIKGNLYVKTTPVVPHPKSSWADAGPAPLF